MVYAKEAIYNEGRVFQLTSKEDDRILTVLTRVGMALSLAGVSVTIISYIRLT